MVLLTKKEAAARLRVSQRTLDRLRSTGAIVAIKVRGVVRFDPAVLERFIARQSR